MKRPSPRRGSDRRTCSLLLALAPLLTLPASAQVGPSKGNVKPKKPVIRVTPIAPKVRVTPVIPRRRPRPAPAPVMKPVKPTPATKPTPPPVAPPVTPPVVPPAPPKPSPLANARKWMAGEQAEIANLVRGRSSVASPLLDLVRAPSEPSPSATPEPELIFQQNVSLQFLREDGGAVPNGVVTVTAPGFTASRAVGRLQLAGPRQTAASPDVRIAASGDWVLVNPADARLVLSTFPGDESRTPLPPRAPGQTATPAPPPLFTSDSERESLRQRAPVSVAPRTAFPTPARHLGLATQALGQARRLIDQSAPVSTEAGPEVRKGLWVNLDQALMLLGQVDQHLEEYDRGARTLRATGGPRAVLQSEYRLDYAPLNRIAQATRARSHQLRAEAQWWSASAERPDRPTRDAALRTVKEALDQFPENAELKSQLARYTEVAEREMALQRRIDAGEFASKPTPRVLVIRTLTRAVALRRTAVDLRVAQSALRANDVVTSSGGAIPFRLEGGYWRTKVGRSQLKTGDVLRVSRKSADSELEAELRVGSVDPYNFEGNDLTRGALRLVALRAFQLAGDPGDNPSVFQELASVDEPGAGLREERRRAGRDLRTTEDGGWWVRSLAVPISYRLRPSPFREEARPDRKAKPGENLETSVENFLRRVSGRGDRSRRITDRVLVDAVRLEGPASGHVGGVRVGSTDQQVEDALGSQVPKNGVISYFNSAVEISLRDGKVDAIEVRRHLGEILGKSAPAAVPGQVTEIRYDQNRFTVKLGPGFQPAPGALLEILVAGKVLADPGGNDTYRAVVLDQTAQEANCKLVRRDGRTGKILGDASWEVLRSLPPAQSNSVTLRTPTGG